MADKPLTPKQERFVEEYLVDLNATQAAKLAGYSEKTAHRIGAENLQKPAIAKAIAEARHKLSERTEITQERILQEYAKIGFSNITSYVRQQEGERPFVDLDDLTEEQSAAISEVTIKSQMMGDTPIAIEEIKFKLWDKLNALEKMGKHLGMFPTRVDHRVSDDDVQYPAVISFVPKKVEKKYEPKE